MYMDSKHTDSLDGHCTIFRYSKSYEYHAEKNVSFKLYEYIFIDVLPLRFLLGPPKIPGIQMFRKPMAIDVSVLVLKYTENGV